LDAFGKGQSWLLKHKPINFAQKPLFHRNMQNTHFVIELFNPHLTKQPYKFSAEISTMPVTASRLQNTNYLHASPTTLHRQKQTGCKYCYDQYLSKRFII
jgi:hypothetical protein